MTEDRLTRLEKDVESLLVKFRGFEDRLAAIESRGPATESKAESHAAVEPSKPAAVSVPEGPFPDPAELSARDEFTRWFSGVLSIASLLGQVCLVLGGGYLLRALTEEGILRPAAFGLGLGFVYGSVWLLLVRRCARRGDSRRATFYGVGSLFIVYPLVWEATTRFEVLSPVGAFLVTGLVTAPALVLAWRFSLEVLAWIATLSSILASVALLVPTNAMPPCVVLLLLLGVATMWIGYHRGWRGLAWLVALAADVVVLAMVLSAQRVEAGSKVPVGLDVELVHLLAVSLFLVYLAGFVVETLLCRRAVRVFEIVQTVVALLVGVGGAVGVAETYGHGSIGLGVTISVLALASYAVAFASSDLQRRNFVFYATLGLVLTITGGLQLSEGALQRTLWCVFAVAVAVLGSIFRRPVLHFHGAVYAGIAAVAAGLSRFSFEVFHLSTWEPTPELSLVGGLALVSGVVSYVAMAASPVHSAQPWRSRIPRLFVAVLSVIGIGASAVFGVVQAFESSIREVDAAVVASVRSGVLAVSAVILAICGRWDRLRELRWLVVPVLVIGGTKLLVEDLVHGHATTLFPAFALFGVALILASQLLRRRSREDSGRSENEREKERVLGR